MTPRKSSYDLSEPAYLKVPKSMYGKYVRVAKQENIHWSELARNVLEAWIIDNNFVESEKVSK